MNHPFEPAAPSPDRLRAQQRQLARVHEHGAVPEQKCSFCEKLTKHGGTFWLSYSEPFACPECLARLNETYKTA